MSAEFDPKLKKVMSEIESIIKREDIGGLVHLVSPSHVEYKLFFEPSWSAVRKIEQDGREALVWQMRQNRRRLAGWSSQDDSLTGHLVFSTRDICANIFLFCEKMFGMVSKHAEVEHKVQVGLPDGESRERESGEARVPPPDTL